MSDLALLPLDPEGLADVVARPASPEHRVEATRRLRPIIAALACADARCVARSDHARGILVEEAFKHVVASIIQHDRRGVDFATWCGQVVDGFFLDVNARWAVIAGEPGQTIERRDTAYTELQPVILELAEAVGRRFPRFLAQDLPGEALSRVLLKIPTFRLTENKIDGFRRWLQTTIYNVGCSVNRRRSTLDPINQAQTGHAMDKKDGFNEMVRRNAPNVEERRETLSEEFRRMRKILDEISWNQERGMVDRRAVFLFDVRIRIGLAFQRELGQQAPGLLAGEVKKHMPWHQPEQESRLRPDMPSLEECWRHATDIFDGPIAEIIAIIAHLNNCLRSQGLSIASGTWNQWSCRARGTARTKMGEEKWKLFARLFQDTSQHIKESSP